MKTSESIKEITVALLKAQPIIETVTKGAINPFFHSKYADINSVIEACKKPLNDVGVVILQPLEGMNVETILIHESGEWMSSSTPVVCKSANNPQDLGGAVTYSRRFGLQSMLLLSAVDDDGNTAIKTVTVTPVLNEETPPDPTEDWDKEFPDKDDEKKVCSKCGSETNFRSGTNAAGKKYAGNFCQNGECKNVDWINVLNVFPSIR